jgi:hypothetical protein
MKFFKWFLILIIGWVFFNSLIGIYLGTVGRCDKNYDKFNKVILYTSCKGTTKNFIEKGLKAGAVTFGNTVLTTEKGLSDDIYLHELQHVKQYLILGPVFLPAYGIAHLVAYVDSKIDNYKNVHAGNFFEIWADKWAHLPPETKYFTN